jgi:hypothetical protein
MDERRAAVALYRELAKGQAVTDAQLAHLHHHHGVVQATPCLVKLAQFCVGLRHGWLAKSH